MELNAIDLAWDTIVRFASEKLPLQFYTDWTSIAADEARHFTLLCQQMETSGAYYGIIPAHDGLWSSAVRTQHSLLARIAVIQLGILFIRSERVLWLTK